jgi:type II secretory pathway component GspD/PulD (secretin)
MLRTALLAVALLISGLLDAADARAQVPVSASNAPAKATAPAPERPCSDSEKNFPPCDLSKENRKQAKKLYGQAKKLVDRKQFDEALKKLQEARAISPQDAVYAASEIAIREKAVSEQLRKGNKAMQQGDAGTALSAFRRAAEVSPANEYAQQRLRDALPAPEEFGSAKLRAEPGETRLRPLAGVQNFDFAGTSLELMQQFAHSFGITTVPEAGLTSRRVKIKMDNVNWETGSEIIARVCKMLIVPMTETQVLLADDTEENRRNLVRMSLRTFYALGGSSPQDLTELTTALRVLFDLRYITPNVAMGSIVIRAPQSTMDAIATFLDYVQDDRPTVMLEVKVFQVSSTLSKDLGTSIPTQFTVFNITSEIRNLVSSSAYAQIVAALQAAGQPVNATTILAGLLASSSSTSSSVLSQPFGTFGGGLTMTGVTLPTSSVHFSGNNALTRTLDDVMLRAGHGKAATLKVGERYPIVSSQFSATSATSSLLSSLGISSSTAAATIPSPQFTYEDLGLTLKATPQVHGKVISLDYELTLRSLGATQANGLPIVNNQEMKGAISTEDGEPVVIAGLISKSEIASLNGLPLVSMLPVLGQAFSEQTKQNTYDELLVVMTPHVVMGRNRPNTGSYITIPMNVPK